MNWRRFQRFTFVTASCFIALPWLTPCGVTAIPVTMIRVTDQSLMTKRDLACPKPSQLAGLEGKPGLPVTVHSNQPVSRSLLISESEWGGGPQGQKWKIEGSGVSGAESVARVLERLDPGRHMQNSKPAAPEREIRKQLVVSLDPLVLIEADRLRFVRAERHGLPLMAEATNGGMMANATLHTQEGNLFVTAHTICFRAASKELILEGNPSLLSGKRQIRSASPMARMRINILSRVVDVNGPVIETFF